MGYLGLHALRKGLLSHMYLGVFIVFAACRHGAVARSLLFWFALAPPLDGCHEGRDTRLQSQSHLLHHNIAQNGPQVVKYRCGLLRLCCLTKSASLDQCYSSAFQTMLERQNKFSAFVTRPDIARNILASRFYFGRAQTTSFEPYERRGIINAENLNFVQLPPNRDSALASHQL